MEFKMHKIAVLDMYDGTPNQGMRAIREILEIYQAVYEVKVFDVRGKAEVPGLEYDVYISTGGPGNPLDGDGVWDKKYFELIDSIFAHNENSVRKKFLFLICHSFQMVSNHLKLGEITKRKSMSFGTFPVHSTKKGMMERLLHKLDNPFYVADFRDWQLVQPDKARFEKMGAEILALEKIRPHIDLERAIMMIRYSNEVVGTQFHPEADAYGMLEHFAHPDRKEQVIMEHHEDKYQQMLRDLSHPGKIKKTHDTIIPTFLENALEHLMNLPEEIPSA